MGREHRLQAGLVCAMAALLLVGAACGGEGAGDDDDDDAGMRSGAASQATSGAPAPGQLWESSSGGAADNAGQAPGTGAPDTGDPAGLVLDRKIIFTAGITLSVENVQSSFGDVSRIASSAGGFIEKSSFANSDGEDPGRRGATLTLRVPADRYQDTLASLRGLPGSTVKNESSKSTEVTEQYTDLQSRLRNLERTEQQYLTLLEQARTIPDILTVQDRLDSVRLQIEQIQGRLKVLNDLTDLATIDVTLAAAAPAKADTGKDGPKSVQEAFSDAWAWFTEASKYVMAGVAVLAVAVIFLALPAGVVAAVALLLSRRKGASAA